MSELPVAIVTVVATVVTVNVAIAIYGIFSRPSLIKKVIALVLFTDSVNILAVIVGFRIAGPFPSPPILPGQPAKPEDIGVFPARSVDPIPQALLVTAIVIGLAVSVFLLGLAVLYYKHFGTTDTRVIPEVEEAEAPK